MQRLRGNRSSLSAAGRTRACVHRPRRIRGTSRVIATLAVETSILNEASQHSLSAAATTAAAAAAQQVQQLLASSDAAAIQAPPQSHPVVFELNAQNFQTFLREAGARHVVVDFFTAWCGPCKVIAPEFERMAGEYDSRGVLFAKLDCSGGNKALAVSLGVRALPTFHVYHKEVKVGEMAGMKAANLRKTIDSALASNRSC